MRNVLSAILLGVLLAAAVLGALHYTYNEGMRVGAKIGMVAYESGYRVEEVRGSCEDMFSADECVKCHDLGDD